MSAYCFLYTADTLAEAGLLEGWLQRHGVPVRMLNRYLAGGIGELPAGPQSAPQLWVREDQFDYACALFAQWQAPQPSADRPWQCHRCGAEGEPGFAECWRCQAPREEQR